MIFIFQTSFFIGIGVMIYLIARAIPRVEDDIPLGAYNPNRVEKWFSKIPTEKLDEVSGKILEKTLRRARLFLLRLDNFVGKRLERVRHTNGNGHSASLKASKNGNGKATLFTPKEEKGSPEDTKIDN